MMAEAKPLLVPDDYAISRKRKKYKFAWFSNLANCFEAEQISKQYIRDFVEDAPLVIEVGAGTALFAVELARQYPETRFIAFDVKADRLYTGARIAIDEQLLNIIFVRAHVQQLPDVLLPSSVSEMWLTFSDPFPRKRQAKHRMTHPLHLPIYRNFLQKNGVLHFKTDNHQLFDWSLEQFVSTGWGFSALTYDLHNSELPSRYKIMTTYEQRYVREGLAICACDVVAKD